MAAELQRIHHYLVYQTAAAVADATTTTGNTNRGYLRGSGASRFQLVLIGLDCTTKDNSVLVVVIVTVSAFPNPAKELDEVVRLFLPRYTGSTAN